MVIARQGDTRWLYQTRGNQPSRGRIVDTAAGFIYPEALVASIAARGYWEPATMDDSSTAAMLAAVTEWPPSEA